MQIRPVSLASGFPAPVQVAAAAPGGPVDAFVGGTAPSQAPGGTAPGAVATRLARAASRFATEVEARQVQERLQAARLSPAEEAALARLADPLPTWKPEGSWRPVPLGDGLQGWTDQPVAERAPTVLGPVEATGERTLTSRDLSLEGLKGCLLEFEEAHAFASNASRAYVEAAVPGGPWETLIEYREDKPRGPQFLDLSPYDGKSVRIRFRTALQPASDPDLAARWNPHAGGVWLEAFVISGKDAATGKSRGLPLEAVMRIQALDDLLALATHLEPGPDRAHALDMLAGLAPEWRARVLPALAARVQQGTLTARDAASFATRLVTGSLVGGGPSHLEETATRPDGIAVEEGAVRVGGVLLERRDA